MKGIVITSDDKISVREFGEPLYKTVGQAVGGYIEVVRPRMLKQPLVIVINEEGRLQDLPVNFVGSYLYGTMFHSEPIVGNIVVLMEGLNDDGESDIIGIPEDKLEKLYHAFRAWFPQLREETAE